MIPIGIIAPPDLAADEFIAYARDAEWHGFDQLWVVEDCFLRGGVAQAAVALAQTTTITVGLGILPAGARNPAFAALDMATLETLFPGRLIVGVGHGMPGWMRQVGAWPTSPVTLLTEYISTLKKLLKGEKVTYAGSYVNLDEAVLESPPRTPPPVLAGVRGPSRCAHQPQSAIARSSPSQSHPSTSTSSAASPHPKGARTESSPTTSAPSTTRLTPPASAHGQDCAGSVTPTGRRI